MTLPVLRYSGQGVRPLDDYPAYAAMTSTSSARAVGQTRSRTILELHSSLRDGTETDHDQP